MAARAHILVAGRVQGVFFRHSAKNKALALGVAGWVRNLPDGRVEAVFEGDEKAVREAVAWCGSGPDGARVEDVDVVWDEKPEDIEGFTVRY